MFLVLVCSTLMIVLLYLLCVLQVYLYIIKKRKMVSDINLSPAVSRKRIFLHSLTKAVGHFATKYDTLLILGYFTFT